MINSRDVAISAPPYDLEYIQQDEQLLEFVSFCYLVLEFSKKIKIYFAVFESTSKLLKRFFSVLPTTRETAAENR